MSDMTRRQKAVPVQARRVEADPQILPSTVKIPGAAAAAPSPGVTQNIIYVNMPAAPAPPPPTDPTEIHVHTHVHQYPARRPMRRNQTSFLGTLAFVLGGVGCATSFVPQLFWLSRPIALTAFACAAIAFLNALISSRVGRTMPMLGILSSSLAYGIWLVRSGQMPMPTFIADGLANRNISTLQIVANPPPQPVTPAPQPAVQPPPQDHSIFGDGANWGNSPANPPDAPPTTPAVPKTIDADNAKVNLETVRVTAAKKIGLDYAAVEAAAASAKIELAQLRAISVGGNPELTAASRRYLNAESDLTDLQKKLESDPSVAAAEAVLRDIHAKDAK